MALRIVFAFFVLAAASLPAGGSGALTATCTPLDKGRCSACKNCRYCGHCAKRGGKCTVCATGARLVRAPAGAHRTLP